MRVVFAGTPAVALPSLEALAQAGHEIVAVLTRPPAAQGRSARLVPSPVAQWAEERGIEVLCPATPRDESLATRLAQLAPDCCPVVAYGGLIPAPLLTLPRLGWINLHFSLLPAYRGAAPVQRAILAGETTTGVTCFELVAALDAGPVWCGQATPIGETESAGELLQRLAQLGSGLLLEALALAAAGDRPCPQPAEGISLAPKLTPADAELDWQQPADHLARLIRAAWPEPGAWTTVAGKRLRLGVAAITTDCLAPGAIKLEKKRLLVGSATTALELGQVIPEGKKLMAATDWGRGLRPSGPLFAGAGEDQ